MPLTLEECSTVAEVIELYENNTVEDEDFEHEVVLRAAEILAENNKELSNSLSYRTLMMNAIEYCQSLMNEIREAIEALDDAYDAEEWDQMTVDPLFDWESDEAMADAAAEIDDVNLLLNEFKGFLYDIGENVAGLYGSDFDFGWDAQMNEALFGDFWGTEMNLGKIQQARGQMMALFQRIAGLEERFLNNIDDIEDYIQETVDQGWQ